MLKLERAIYCHKIFEYKIVDGHLSISGEGYTIDKSNAKTTFQLFGNSLHSLFSNRVPSKKFEVSEDIYSIDVITGSTKAPTEYGALLDKTAVYISETLANKQTKIRGEEGTQKFYGKLYEQLEKGYIRMTGDVLNFLMKD